MGWNDKQVARLLHQATWLATQAERAVSRGLGGSCSMPLAAHAVWMADGRLSLRAVLGADEIAAPSSALPLLRAAAQAKVGSLDEAIALGAAVVQQLHGLGALRYLSPSVAH